MHLVWIILLFFSSAFKTPPHLTHFKGTAHTHPYHIQIADKLSKPEENQVIELIENIFNEVDLYYNSWNPFSELSAFNRLPLNEQLLLSSPLFDLIQKARKLTHLTEGHFDPSLGSMIKLWKENLRQGIIPNEMVTTGWNHFEFEGGQGKRLISDIAIDLDGFLKGHVIDQLLQNLNKLGHENVYIEWGGDIRVSGKHPSGRNWNARLENEIISLENHALATSGISEQSFSINGECFSHILIPETKQAIQDPEILSVSVKASTCIFADALATALMTFSSPNKALEWLEKKQFENCTVWIYGKENERFQWTSKH